MYFAFEQTDRLRKNREVSITAEDGVKTISWEGKVSGVEN